jgi:hypothetical protein
MANHPAFSSYAKIIGEIAITWNKLERRLDSLIFHYLTVESDVAGFILGAIGNEMKAELAKFLIEKYEKNSDAKSCGLLCVALLNRLRENRNILEHAIPHLNYNQQYIGTIGKADKRGMTKAFVAPISNLKDLVKSINSANSYMLHLISALHIHKDASDDRERLFGKVMLTVASEKRPQIPDKISPLLPPEVLEDDSPQRQSFQASGRKNWRRQPKAPL